MQVVDTCLLAPNHYLILQIAHFVAFCSELDPWGQTVMEYESKCNNFSDENAFDIVVCKVLPILSMSLWINNKIILFSLSLYLSVLLTKLET